MSGPRKRKSFEIVRSRSASCPPEVLMDRVLTPATWPAWQSEIVTAQGPSKVETGAVVAGRARMLGFDVDGQSIADHVDHGSFEESVVVGVGMTIRYEVRAAEGGSEVTHRLTSELPRGTLGVVLSFFLKRRFRRMQRQLLERLVRQAEAAAD